MPDALPSLDCFASAIALFVWLDVEVSVTSAPLTLAPAGVSTSAMAFAVTMLTAIDPATPTLLPPAPEVACAEKAELPVPGATVSTVTLLAVRLAPLPTYALVLRTTTLTATATPMPELASAVGIAPAGVVLELSV